MMPPLENLEFAVK